MQSYVKWSVEIKFTIFTTKLILLDRKVSELQELIPEASIGFVHGQMSEIQLENTYWTLLKTTGYFWWRSLLLRQGQMFKCQYLIYWKCRPYGLSTLYQLRGRVGRSNRIAYAYLMYRPENQSVKSLKRLAIKDFIELGSGFKIAMRSFWFGEQEIS